jgi:ATP-dependent DNA helicase RecG
MERDDLFALLKGGETSRVVMKGADFRPAKLAETLAALANSDGGTLILGIDARLRSTSGLEDPEQAARALAEAARLCNPPLVLPLPERMTMVDGRTLLVATVPDGLPHVYDLDGRYLGRAGTQNRPLGADALKRLLIERGQINYETLPVRGAAFADLDMDKVGRYLAVVRGSFTGTPEEILRDRGCLVRQDAGWAPTNAGMLLFGRTPPRQAQILLVRYAGRNPSDQFLRKEIQGTLPDAVQEAQMWLLANMRKGSRLEGSGREDFTEYPEEAVREAIVNAVAHRDYSLEGEGIRITMFSDRIEFYSPGRLPGHVTVDNILDERYSRNPVIVQVMADMGMIERLGYGINRMVHLMAEWNLQPPAFKETTAGFLLTLFGPGDRMVVQQPARADVDLWARQGLNERQITALRHLTEHESITNREFRELCPDVTDETARRDLADLVDRNLILKVGDKRATYYILK